MISVYIHINMKATKRDICYHKTGHAGAAQVEFDPNEVSYEDLLDVFWSKHNPTTKNRQEGGR
jgi:peptide-methionine (S)-S-oxide reductase